MAKAIRLLAWLGILAAVLTARSARAEQLDYPALVQRLVDPQRLAVLPAAGEACGLQSSYDRRSRYDTATSQYVHWDANDDGFTPQFIRKEGDNEVLAEMTGPGCIWRTWSASPKDGHVKIFIDGETTPTVDLPFSGYFDGRNAPFDYPSLVYTAARGQDCYVPIPYQKSCKIVADPGWGQYYQFTYTTFPKDTILPRFGRRLSGDAVTALKRVDGLLSARSAGPVITPPVGGQVESREVVAAAGKTTGVLELSGEGAITSLRVRMAFDDRADQIATLREMVLRMSWDGESQPGVWCPLGDFFGTAMGVNHYRTLMSGMTDDGFYASWYMPYAKGAKIEITNDGARDRRLTFELVHAPLTRPAAELGRFHAKWHRDAMRPVAADRWPDWSVLATTGRGRFCGMMLHAWTPRGGHNWQYAREGGWWWGEGDEKFFVDGEKFPSTFGTGTEDYFGYAWCEPSLFERPFHAQTLTQQNKGHQSVVRWQVADAVPFQRSFDGCLEKYNGNDFPTRFAVVAYWYLETGGHDPYGAVPLADRVGYYDLTDATEGENLKVVQCTGGTTTPQTIMANRESGDSLWSGGTQLWWRGAKPGDRLELAVPVARAGHYRVKAGMTAAADYGTVRLTFAGKTPLAPVDFFQTELRPAEVDLGDFELPAGPALFTLELTAANPKAKGQCMAGLDYVKLVPTP